ncbi:TRMT5 [Cordylochernes scorpioides]|uniref:tRNA (guanine(37)-N1)-methyltransferase n=1 Tax=Cordylochernes scorpioides TaxID=51811 RepID=A0ABY6LCV5_9ARAC|nr:TRMT5 [Cordylochernes scorpioides]
MSADKVLEPPSIVRNMKVLNPELFHKRVSIPYVECPTVSLQTINKFFHPCFLKLYKINIVERIDDIKSMLLLDPEKIDQINEILKKKVDILKELNIENVKWKEIDINFDNWSISDIMKAILPPNTSITSYSKIGHIIHLNLKDEHQEYKNIIGEIYLNKIISCKTVINKLDNIDSTFRNFKVEILAGSPELVTTVKEEGCTFKLDFEKGYWNPRLGTEHKRIITKLMKGDILFDVFAGIGPFAIPIARKKCFAYANDLNPHSYKWLLENIKINKMEKSIQAYNLDGRDFIQTVIKDKIVDYLNCPNYDIKRVHITMNLPAMAIEFIDAFKGILSEKTEYLPTIHLYCFVKNAEDSKKEAVAMLRNKMQCDADILEVMDVRTVAPKKDMIRITFQPPMDYLVEEEEANQPPCKRPHLEKVENIQHHFSQKVGLVKALIYRAFTLINDTTKRNIEINNIKKELINEDFPIKLIDRIIEDMNQKYENNTLIQNLKCKNKEAKFITLPFINQKFARYLTNIFKKYEKINIAWKPCNPISQYINNHKNTHIPNRAGLIYEVKCEKCDQCYAGQTSRTLKERMKNHEYALKWDKIENSALVEHRKITGHNNFNLKETKILDYEKNYFKRQFKEAFFIQKKCATINRMEERGNINSSSLLLFVLYAKLCFFET